MSSAGAIMSIIFLVIIIALALMFAEPLVTEVAEQTGTDTFIDDIYDQFDILYPAFLLILFGIIGTFVMVVTKTV